MRTCRNSPERRGGWLSELIVSLNDSECGEWLLGGGDVFTCCGHVEQVTPGISGVAGCRSRGFARHCGRDGDLALGDYDPGMF